MSALIVAGFHRSGTSAVARSLHLAGLHLGDELLGSEPSNPHGHYEDSEVIDIHQEILDVNGLDWKVSEPFEPYVPDSAWAAMAALVHRRNATGRPWGFKDPRVCLFLPLWLHLVPDASILVVFRNPAEAVRSLYMRHSRQMVVNKGRGEVHRDFWRIPDLATRMWVTYHRMLLRSLPGDDRVHVVDFGDRAAVAGIIESVNRRFDLGLDEGHADALDPTLGATGVDPVSVRDAELVTEVEEVWRLLHERAHRSAALLGAVAATAP